MQGSDNTEEQDALARGVRYRAIYERALLEGPGELDSVREGISWGEEARVAPALPIRLAIVDRSTAICPLTHDRERHLGEPSAAVIGRGQLLDALLDLFEGHWLRASPLSVSGALGGDIAGAEGIGDAERLLLSLVVAGIPDKSIASQLGVSRRTVQRRLDRLMAVAGVDTRTALAYQAARRGWL
jgi:DNA-binding CsgD family transcriptional regulator